MIELKLKVRSFYYLKENFKKIYREYNIIEKYDDDITLNEVLRQIFNKYKIDNGKFENYFIPYLADIILEQFFSKKICHMIDIKDAEYLELKLIELEKQFNISQIEIPIYLNYDGIGKSIGVKEGISFIFHFDEKDIHHNPHIHCKYSGKETRIEIETLKVLDKPFKKSKIDVAKKFIEENREELLDYWDKVIMNGQSIELKIDI